ncbi:hypothetical protein SLEP1_g3520 [Rubroshorea leprosula]|uniref:Uncharacterized protein n=1 Tax=Rubroshorea leprosula TaxID=152421 RepID=A0AAV5HV94_9ROSI|nr:hypothetical protein SLEP1_g3520 [Rubroshorea leprosula]
MANGYLEHVAPTSKMLVLIDDGLAVMLEKFFQHQMMALGFSPLFSYYVPRLVVSVVKIVLQTAKTWKACVFYMKYYLPG